MILELVLLTVSLVIWAYVFLLSMITPIWIISNILKPLSRFTIKKLLMIWVKSIMSACILIGIISLIPVEHDKPYYLLFPYVLMHFLVPEVIISLLIYFSAPAVVFVLVKLPTNYHRAIYYVRTKVFKFDRW
jgi:hypothetical protein